jgi:hypothetical protein
VRHAAALRLSLGIAGIGAAGTVSLCCQSTEPGSTCELSEVAAYPASPLMLLPDAHLDHVPSGFFISGVDKDLMRWAQVDNQRVLGKELNAPVPASRRGGPWLAVAGRTAAADTVVVAFSTLAANGSDLDINVFTAPADGSAAPGPAAVVATIVGGGKAGAAPAVALSSSQTGMRAALAWTATGTGNLTALLLGADGRAVGDPLPVDAAARVGCVAFVPGKADLSLAYFRYLSPSDTLPVWVIAELRDAAGIEGTLSLALANDQPSCPLVIGSAAGYALAWQNVAGSHLGTYDGQSNQFFDHLFSSAVEFGGPKLQPPLAGLGLAGNDFVVVIARAGGGEAWRVAANGARQSGRLLFPSVDGHPGTISSAPAAGSLFSSYADYEQAAPTATATGQRYLIETTCL